MCTTVLKITIFTVVFSKIIFQNKVVLDLKIKLKDMVKNII